MKESDTKRTQNTRPPRFQRVHMLLNIWNCRKLLMAHSTIKLPTVAFQYSMDLPCIIELWELLLEVKAWHNLLNSSVCLATFYHADSPDWAAHMVHEDTCRSLTSYSCWPTTYLMQPCQVPDKLKVTKVMYKISQSYDLLLEYI